MTTNEPGCKGTPEEILDAVFTPEAVTKLGEALGLQLKNDLERHRLKSIVERVKEGIKEEMRKRQEDDNK